MDDFLILDYEEIIKEYDEQLVSKLRDFGRDYLKFWIPEENIVLSLLNLFFSIVLQLQNINKNILEEILNNYFIELKLEKTKIIKKDNYVVKTKNEISLKELRKFYIKKNHKFRFRIDSSEFNNKSLYYKSEIDKYKFGVKLNNNIIEEAYFSTKNVRLSLFTT